MSDEINYIVGMGFFATIVVSSGIMAVAMFWGHYREQARKGKNRLTR
jgi:hypothetical protein